MPPKSVAITRKITTRATGQRDAAAQAATTGLGLATAGQETAMEEITPTLIRTIIREEINAAIGKLQPQLDAVKKDMAACNSKVAEVEETLCTMDTRLETLEKSNELLLKENDELKIKAERLEGYSRRFNIRVFGVISGAEKGNPTSYMASLLAEMFKDKLSAVPGVEIAHRVGPTVKSGNRAMIVRMTSYTVKEELVKIAKKDGILEVRGMRLRIFPDQTADMAKKRGLFREVREKLWKAGVKQGIIHPATLVITYKEETMKFKDHEEAETFWKDVIEPELQVLEENGQS